MYRDCTDETRDTTESDNQLQRQRPTEEIAADSSASEGKVKPTKSDLSSSQFNVRTTFKISSAYPRGLGCSTSVLGCRSQVLSDFENKHSPVLTRLRLQSVLTCMHMKPVLTRMQPVLPSHTL